MMATNYTDRPGLGEHIAPQPTRTRGALLDEHSIIRSMLRLLRRGAVPSSPLGKAMLGWAQPHSAWLRAEPDFSAKLSWDDLTGVVDLIPPTERCPQVLDLADDLAELLALAPFDATLLRLMIACDRLPRVNGLARIVSEHRDLAGMIGELAGSEPNDAARAVRRSAVLRLGLVALSARRSGSVEVDVRWPLERLLDRPPADRTGLLDALLGTSQRGKLELSAFAHVKDVDLLVRLLCGSLAEHAAGINILIHGPPGTGKTELARTLAAAASAALYGVGEADRDGDEPCREDRVNALQIAQRLLTARGEAVLLFDEMEDLIGDARPSAGDWLTQRQGSKLFVNRMLETNAVPIIWTTNAVGNIDGAILRRMSFVVKLDFPPRSAAHAMLTCIAADERITPNARYSELLEAAPEAATVLRVAARAGRLAGEADGGVRAAEALVKALRGGELPPPGPAKLDLGLFESDMAIKPLFAAISEAGAEDVSLLLTGPPGTGKTALAHHLARALDRPLIVKRASDLLSKWVGGTEARIAAAFAEARERGGVLLFDEADSLLFDRATAANSWEVGQVNELLTWLDSHPLPVIAATNHPGHLDPATLRRFVFKLALRPLSGPRLAHAFERFFHLVAPPQLMELSNLTPGDFAVVAKQLRYAVGGISAGAIADRLAAEAAAKPCGCAKMGF